MKKGWEIKKLGEVCEFQNGFAFKGNSFKDNGFPVLRISNIQNNDVDFNNLVFIDETGYKEDLSKYKVEKGDLLIAMSGGTTGKIGFNKSETVFLLNQRVGKFIPKKELVKIWLYYFLLEKVEDNLKISAGSAQPNLSTEQIKSFAIPIPPLPEQQRIVSILDEAFTSIEQAKENLQRNLQNAKELFQSELNSIFTNKGEGWEGTTLKANIELSTGFAFKSKFYTDNEDDILLLRGDNIMQGNFRWQDAKRWNKSEYHDYEKYQLQENDIVLAMDRPWVKAGLKCAKLTINEMPSLLVQRTARLRANSKIDSSFLYHLIRSRGFITYLLKGQTGLGVPHISGPQILSFSFSRPLLTEQQKIVQQLDKLSAETKRLEAMYQQKLNALEELKKSILQKAFLGELSN